MLQQIINEDEKQTRRILHSISHNATLPEYNTFISNTN